MDAGIFRLSSSGTVATVDNDMRKPSRNAKARLCDCGGRFRHRDARKHSIPGVPEGAHRWVCEKCGALKTRWQVLTPAEKERERAQSRRASAVFRAQIRALIAEAKDRPCEDCGGRFPTCAMDLDHVRGEKSFKVSEAVQLAFATTLERVRFEIAKCEVVCANCHRIRTEARGYVNEQLRAEQPEAAHEGVSEHAPRGPDGASIGY